MPPGTPRPRAETSGGCRCPPMAGRPGTVRCESPQGTTTPFTSSRRPAGPAASPAWVGRQTPSAPGYATYLRAYSVTKGWLGPAVKVSPAYGNCTIWPGDTLGLATLPGSKIAVSWGSAVGTHKDSEIWAATVRLAGRGQPSRGGAARCRENGNAERPGWRTQRRLGACGGHVIPCPGSCVRGTGRHASLCRLTPPPAGRQRLL